MNSTHRDWLQMITVLGWKIAVKPHMLFIHALIPPLVFSCSISLAASSIVHLPELEGEAVLFLFPRSVIGK